MLRTHFSEAYEKALRRLNNLNLGKKFACLYIICVFLPVVLTNAAVFQELLREERIETQRRAESIASAVQYDLTYVLETSDTLARSIYISDYVQDFLNTQYEDPEEYVSTYLTFRRDSMLQSVMGLNSDEISFYAANDTIVNGGGFFQLSEIEGESWYQRFSESPCETMLLFFHDGKTRRCLYLRSLNRNSYDSVEKLLTIELDYGNLMRSVLKMNYDLPVYVCCEDEVLFTNAEPNYLMQPFDRFMSESPPEKELDFSWHGAALRVYVLRNDSVLLSTLRSRWSVLLLLSLASFLLPLIIMQLIVRSITYRIRHLNRVFDEVNSDELIPITGELGGDEIGDMMRNYNRMTERLNALIEAVFKNQIREQEMDIARKDAELHALHSQINPHFLFNALETIRMRSVLKSEDETARMIEILALLERENMDWSSDRNTIAKEMEFTRNYLEFQKYRFGDRLSYDLSIQESCRDFLIPKLAITTFVENACVHGIGGKRAPGWVFVRVFEDDRYLKIEVEDTGMGLDEEEASRLSNQMSGASIDMLKRRSRVGIVNVCLRIRMICGENALFSVASEKGVGTEISISLPLDKLEKRDPVC